MYPEQEIQAVRMMKMLVDLPRVCGKQSKARKKEPLKI